MRVSADREKLKTVLSNLISNAIKYSPQGGTVHLRALRLNGQLVFDVADAGPNVPVAERERIFEPFYTGAPPRQSHVRGTRHRALARPRVRARARRPDRTGRRRLFRCTLPPDSAADTEWPCRSERSIEIGLLASPARGCTTLLGGDTQHAGAYPRRARSGSRIRAPMRRTIASSGEQRARAPARAGPHGVPARRPAREQQVHLNLVYDASDRDARGRLLGRRQPRARARQRRRTPGREPRRAHERPRCAWSSASTTCAPSRAARASSPPCATRTALEQRKAAADAQIRRRAARPARGAGEARGTEVDRADAREQHAAVAGRASNPGRKGSR